MAARAIARMNKEEIRTALRNLNPQVEKEFQAEIEAFFGSRARGDASEDSDLDVLVRFGEHASLYDLVGLGDFLESVFHCKVDVVSTRAISDELQPHIIEDLVRV